MLETKNPSDEWPAEETEGLTLTVIKLNEQTLELEPALTVSLADASTATLAQLKAALEEKVMLTLFFEIPLPSCHSHTRAPAQRAGAHTGWNPWRRTAAAAGVQFRCGVHRGKRREHARQ
jgi:hypothetical protein